MSTAPVSDNGIAVSVVIPAYNAELFIRNAIQSVQSQTLSNIEIIVIDDASTDFTSSIVKEIMAQDSRIVYLRMKSNSGPSASRNFGISHARGQWVALLDADDQFFPHRLERLTDIGHAHSADMVSDNLLLYTATDKIEAFLIPKAAIPYQRALSFSEFINGCHPDRQNPEDRTSYVLMHPIFRQEFLIANRIAYDETCRNGEDFLLYTDCLLMGAQWFITSEPMYKYLMRKGSLTDIASREDRHSIVLKLDSLLKDRRVSDNVELYHVIKRFWKFTAGGYHYYNFKNAIKQLDIKVALHELLNDKYSLGLITQEIIKRGASRFMREIRGGNRSPGVKLAR